MGMFKSCSAHAAQLFGGPVPASVTRAERLEIIRALDAHGVFNMRRAMAQVAATLAVSCATALACLLMTRAEAKDETRAGHNEERQQ